MNDREEWEDDFVPGPPDTSPFGQGTALLAWWEICAHMVLAVPGLHFSGHIEHEPDALIQDEQSLAPVRLTVSHPDHGPVLVGGPLWEGQALRKGELQRYSLRGVMEGSPRSVAQNILLRQGLPLEALDGGPNEGGFTVAVAWALLGDVPSRFNPESLVTLRPAGPDRWSLRLLKWMRSQEENDIWSFWAMAGGEAIELDLERGMFIRESGEMPFELTESAGQRLDHFLSENFLLISAIRSEIRQKRARARMYLRPNPDALRTDEGIDNFAQEIWQRFTDENPRGT